MRGLWCGALALVISFYGACDPPPAPRPKPQSVADAGAAAAKAELSRTCPDGKCMAVPEGIRGLAFGMSEKQAAAVVGRLRRGKVSRRRVGEDDCRERVPLPGKRTIVSTTIGSEKADCELWFLGPDDAGVDRGAGGFTGLAVIDCDLDGRRKRDEHTETVWLLYHSLAKQYGNAPSLADRVDRRGWLRAEWKDARAELIVTASLRGRRSSIELINRSPRYADALAAQEAGVEARCEAEAAARARERAERAARRRERARDFENDLRPPGEKP